MIDELIKKTRTVRRFLQDKAPDKGVIEEVIALTAFTASAANLQRLRYMTVTGEKCREMYNYISLGGYFKAEDKPTADEAPTAYVIMLAPTDAKDANIFIDAGISAEAMMLGFAKRGIFGCMIRSFNKESVSELASADGYEPLMVIALGYPAEEVKVASVAECGYKYFRDEEGCHVVPKLSADRLILK